MLYEHKFSEIIKYHFKDFFAAHGFQPYKTTMFGRIVNNDFFQFFNFQKASGDEKSIMVDFTNYLLFEKKTSMFEKVITLKPGGSIGNFLQNRPDLRWFEYDTQEKLDKSVKVIKEIIMDHAFQWFDDHYKPEHIFLLSENRQLRVTDDVWRYVDYIFMYLRMGDIEKALEMADYIIKYPPSLEEITMLCKNVINDITSKDFDRIGYLNKIVIENKENLKLKNIPLIERR